MKWRGRSIDRGGSSAKRCAGSIVRRGWSVWRGGPPTDGRGRPMKRRGRPMKRRGPPTDGRGRPMKRRGKPMVRGPSPAAAWDASGRVRPGRPQKGQPSLHGPIGGIAWEQTLSSRSYEPHVRGGLYRRSSPLDARSILERQVCVPGHRSRPRVQFSKGCGRVRARAYEIEKRAPKPYLKDLSIASGGPAGIVGRSDNSDSKGRVGEALRPP